MAKEDFLEEGPILGHLYRVPVLPGSSPCTVPPRGCVHYWPHVCSPSAAPARVPPALPARAVRPSSPSVTQGCLKEVWLLALAGDRNMLVLSSLVKPESSFLGGACPWGATCHLGLPLVLPVVSSLPLSPASHFCDPIPAGWKGQPQALEESREDVDVSRQHTGPQLLRDGPTPPAPGKTFVLSGALAAVVMDSRAVKATLCM